MAKKDDWGKIIIVGIGLYLTWKFLQSLGRDVNTYHCGNCNGLIKENEQKCPWCGKNIIWEKRP